jgi:hypothetical protein
MIEDPTRCFTRSPETLFRTVGDEVLLTRAGRHEVDLLSGSAAMTWLLLERTTTLTALLESLAGLYRVAVDDIEEDVGRLLSDLVVRGWVETVGGASDCAS